jgi:tRNA/tmRNA/rRNA uracil-C5-methylase (TrmA/RlmC/RlmD family)
LHLQESAKDRASIANARNLVILAGSPDRQSEHCPHAALNLAEGAMF